MIFQKIGIISDVIIPVATVLKNFFYHFHVTLQSMTVSNFKNVFLSGFMDKGEGGAMCSPPGHNQTAYVAISENMLLDVNVYNSLTQKAKC